MATRFYPTKTSLSPAALVAAWSSEWELTTVAGFRIRTDKPDSDPPQTVSRTGTGAIGDDTGVFQMHSDPISAQLISGTLRGLIAAEANTPGSGALAYIVVRVASATLGTIRGTLYSGSGGSLPAGGGRKSVAYPSYPGTVALTDVQAEEGDRIIVEFGVRKTAGDSSAILYVEQGAASTDTDHAAVGEATSGKCGWIEFSQDLWPATSPLTAEASVSSGGTGTMEATGGSPDSNVTTVVALSFVGGDLDVYEPVPIVATCAAEAFLGGDLTDVLFLSEET